MGKMLKCNSCGATYPDTRDGNAPMYFHVCPDQIVDTPEEVNEKHEIVNPATFKPVANPRNENLKQASHLFQEVKTFVMVSEGEGITEV